MVYIPRMGEPSSEQPETRPDYAEPKGHGSHILLLWSSAFLVVYVLGVGPAALLEQKVPSSSNVVDAVYAPVGFLWDHCEPLGRAGMWYLKLWGVTF